MSRICLLTFLSSLFAGFMRRHVGWLAKLSLWSYRVIKACLFCALFFVDFVDDFVEFLLEFVVDVSKFYVVHHVQKVGFKLVQVFVLRRTLSRFKPKMIIVSCVVVVLFVAVEEKCFPSHAFDDTYFLDQALQITVSWWYRYVFS